MIVLPLCSKCRNSKPATFHDLRRKLLDVIKHKLKPDWNHRQGVRFQWDRRIRNSIPLPDRDVNWTKIRGDMALITVEHLDIVMQALGITIPDLMFTYKEETLSVPNTVMNLLDNLDGHIVSLLRISGDISTRRRLGEMTMLLEELYDKFGGRITQRVEGEWDREKDGARAVINLAGEIVAEAKRILGEGERVGIGGGDGITQIKSQ